MKPLRTALALAFLVATLDGISEATNGMNLEAYGPVAMGMGGASVAYDNGAAAVMNNPATLALMSEGRRLDLAVGLLGPSVNASVGTPQGRVAARSLADAFYMPAGGWVVKRGRTVFGIAAFAQGGMGTEYGSSSWLSDPSQGSNTALPSGLVNRSEVSMGRVLVPFAIDVNSRLSVGGTVDLVWAGMDLQMAMSESQFVDLATAQNGGRVSGTLVEAFGGLYEGFGGTGVRRLHHAYFDFSNGSAFTGQAKGVGFGAKLGAVYRASSSLTIGASYHTKTRLGDLETDQATVWMGLQMDTGLAGGGPPSGQYADLNIPISGSIVVEDFQWPDALGVGLAYRPNDRLLLAFDLRRIRWSGVMKQFGMRFAADSVPENGAFGGKNLDAALYQDWEDQTVIALGGAYRVTQALQFRAGYNRSRNPVPDVYLNALFPAIVEDHLTFGLGYALGDRAEVELGLSKGLEEEFTNPGNGSTIPSVTSSHSQLNAQLMLSTRF